MAKVRIKHPDTGVVYVVDVNNLTEEDLRRLERLNIAEEVEEKPKRKKKYKNVEQKKDDGWGEEVYDENAKEKTEKALELRAEEIDALKEMEKRENKSDK